MAISSSLLAVAEKVTLLQAAGVPDLDVSTIIKAATSSSEVPGTSTAGITPQGPQNFTGAPAPPSH